MQVLDSDSRMSVTVVAADGKTYPLRYWDVITRHFSTLGDKAEWRIIRTDEGVRPVALIVRVKASEDPESARQTDYLAVAKLDDDAICVVDRVPAGPLGNARARNAADAAVAMPCIQDLP